MNYKERLDKLESKSLKSNVNDKLIKEVQDIDLTFDFADNNTIQEFWSFIMRYMKNYNIGQKVSKRFWGMRGYKEIQKHIYDAIEKQMVKKKPKSVLDLYDDLKQDVDGKANKDYQPYTYARVARTEGKAITTVYQLERFKEAGLKYVRHRTRNDNKVANECALHNNREDEIDWLLSTQGEKSRPPRHPNCRCRVEPSMKGV